MTSSRAASLSVLASARSAGKQVDFNGQPVTVEDAETADYAGLDVKGKIVVVLSGYPKGMNSEQGAHLNAEKALMAMKRGAVGIITVPTLQDTARRSWERRVELSDSPTKGWLTPAGEPFRATRDASADQRR